jgi:hypothetical protein
VLLGVIIHKITGEPYDQFLGERIFKPLGMASTRLISDRAILPNRSAGYEIDKDTLKNQEWVSPTFNSTADGALYFNVIDLTNWDEALYGTQLVKQSSLDRMWTVYPLNNGKMNPANYGFAWVIDAQNGHKRISHSGAWQGFTCDISRYPDDTLTVVVLTNLGEEHSNPELIAHVIAGLVAAPLLPPKLTPIADSQPVIAAALSSLLDEAAAGKDIRPRAAPQLAAILTPEANKRVRERLTRLWPGGTLVLVKRGPTASDARNLESTFRLNKGADALLISFGLNSSGKVSTLGLSPDRDYE